MTKRKSRIIGFIMLIVAVVFLFFAMQHPEMSFPWNNTVTYSLYIVYLVFMIIMFIAPFKRNK